MKTSTMELDTLVGQERAAELFRAAIENERLGHAYLLTGLDGIGKTLFAHALARSLLCPGETPPCRKCRDCLMVASGRHPDLFLVEAEEGKRFISIKQGRAVGRFLSLRPVQAGRRVIIVREADRMTEEAANSLLKTLEEPSSFGMLLLTTSHPRALLDTIRSRCQEIRLAPLSSEQVIEILGRDPEQDPSAAAEAARLSGGSPGKARQLLESGVMTVFGEVLPGVLALPEGDLFLLSDCIQDWMRQAGTTLENRRGRLREMLRLFLMAFRDMLLLATGGIETPDFTGALGGPLRRRAAELQPGTIIRMIDAVQEARRQVDRNAAIGLILDNLFTRLGELQGTRLRCNSPIAR